MHTSQQELTALNKISAHHIYQQLSDTQITAIQHQISHILVSHYLVYCCDLCILVVLLAVCTNSIVLCAVSGYCFAVYTSELCVVVLISYVRFCTKPVLYLH